MALVPGRIISSKKQPLEIDRRRSHHKRSEMFPRIQPGIPGRNVWVRSGLSSSIALACRSGRASLRTSTNWCPGTICPWRQECPTVRRVGLSTRAAEAGTVGDSLASSRLALLGCRQTGVNAGIACDPIHCLRWDHPMNASTIGRLTNGRNPVHGFAFV